MILFDRNINSEVINLGDKQIQFGYNSKNNLFITVQLSIKQKGRVNPDAKDLTKKRVIKGEVKDIMVLLNSKETKNLLKFLKRVVKE